MYDVCDIDTGEVVMTCNDFDHRWYDDGKRRTKRELKAMGYKPVKVEYTLHGANMTVWAKREEN